MSRRARHALTSACLGLLWLGFAAAAGTGLRTAPAWLTLTPDQSSAELTLSNTGEHPLHAQVRLYRWTQDAGQERLTPTRDLAVSPPVMQIAPRQQQIVRLIRTGEPPADHESSYRIIVDQLPRADVAGHQTVLRYSAPVFIAPPSPGAPHLTASLTRDAGRLMLRVENRGNRHARLADLGYRDARGSRIVVAGELAGYVLPGQYRTWALPERTGGYAAGQFVAKVNQDPAERPLPRSSR